MKKTILVIDDDLQIREALRKFLAGEGYQVLAAADGQAGIDRFEARHIDLLLLDLNLPGRSGWDTYERVTSRDPLLPIVIITGRHQQLPLAMAAGVGALMEKPLDLPVLLGTIAELLAEAPESRLRRLAGFHPSTRYVQPRAERVVTPAPHPHPRPNSLPTGAS